MFERLNTRNDPCEDFSDKKQQKVPTGVCTLRNGHTFLSLPLKDDGHPSPYFHRGESQSDTQDSPFSPHLEVEKNNQSHSQMKIQLLFFILVYDINNVTL